MIFFIGDANIFLRYFTHNPPKMAKQVKEFFEKVKKSSHKVLIYPVTLTEIIYHLRKTYKMKKEVAVTAIFSLLLEEWVIVPNKEIILKALEVYRRNNLDLEDAILFSMAQHNNMKVVTFDRDFKKLDPTGEYIILLDQNPPQFPNEFMSS